MDESKAIALVSTPVVVPACYTDPVAIDRNPLQQLLIRSHQATIARDPASRRFHLRLETGQVVGLEAGTRPISSDECVLRVPTAVLKQLPALTDLSAGTWVGTHAPLECDVVRQSLAGQFRFIVKAPDRGESGLRPPQIGAVHAVLGYWTTNEADPATVVMPTGTGKTDTMLALFCAAEIERLLVIVPSDALRAQIAAKFMSFGVLQDVDVGVIPETCHRPVVGRIEHGFTSADTAARFADRCNVMVATPAALLASPAEIRTALLSRCSHLFVDEAHHVAASTWRLIRDAFDRKRVVQFTATPFREDGRHLGGRLVYAFPLGEAQRQGYFSQIRYISVLDSGDHDRAIAAHAVWQLRQDLAAGYDHLIMARVSRIGRADEILPIYARLAPEFEPVVLHSRSPVGQRREALSAIADRRSRIVICVDMLGEGFDLPALKIAAIHDAHKSLGITLQFIGRFARTVGAQLGSATAVVGRPDGDFDSQLRRLYAENADWNLIITDLSEGVIDREQKVSDFEAAFGTLPEEVSLRSLLPKMSAVVYRVEAEAWNPQAIKALYAEDDGSKQRAARLLTELIAVNDRDGVAWFVRENRASVDWGELRTVEEITHDLFVLYLDRDRQLLYINSSDNGSVHQDLAEAVCGASATRITGENIYRVMAQVKRLVPTNVGVLDVRNRSRRFSMHVGADVVEGFPIAEAQTKTKTNIFAYGYEAGNRVSVGASLKGRIWSYRRAATLKHWVDWCDHVGSKLIDDGISVDDVIQQFIRPQSLDTRPSLIPLSLEWPWELLANTSDEVRVRYQEKSWPAVDVGFELRSHATSGPIEFRLRTADWQLAYELVIGGGQMQFVPVGDDALVSIRNQIVPLRDFLTKTGLQVFFEQDAVVVPPAMLLKPDRTIPPYDPAKLIALDWTGINLSIESQGTERRADSVQARTIAHVLSLADWDLVIDDDTSGEIADIVALRVEADTLQVHLTHCKYVRGGRPRRRVEDLFEVCGQAQKSTQWRRSIPVLFAQLIKRQRKRLSRTGRDGFMKGDFRTLYELEDRARLLKPCFTIAMSQPGVTKSRITAAQLALLSSTEVYVYETAYGAFEVYCSP